MVIVLSFVSNNAGRKILICRTVGTTHADFCHSPVPCTRPLKPEEIAEEYETNTGRVIAERFGSLDSQHIPEVLVAEHGPFAWGAAPDQAVAAAVTLEQVARIASETLKVDPSAGPISRELLEKHFLRKHGPDAYYGQT